MTSSPKYNEQELIQSAENTPQAQFDQFLKKLEDEYHNGVSIVSDYTYDKLTEIYKQKYGERAVVGALPRSERTNLPQYLPSLDKVKTEKELDLWLKKYPGNYVIEDKLDGLTLLFVQKDGLRKLYTRGDGSIGADVSHLVPYLKLPVLQGNFAIRGEIALSKANYATIASEFVNSRNVVSGAVNARNSFRPDLVAKFDFVAYRIFNAGIPPSAQIMHLRQLGFKTPWAVVAANFDIKKLEAVFTERKEKSEYDLDGLVIYQDAVLPETDPSDHHAKGLVAFKVEGDTAITTVRDVIWQASRFRILTPVVIYDPVFLSGAELTNAHGNNAKWIIDRKIGKNASIKIHRSGETIPHILDVVSPATDWMLPKPEQGAYGWDENQVRFVLFEDNDEVRADRLKYFVKKLGIKNFGEKRVLSMIQAGIDTIDKLLRVTPEELTKIDRMGPKLSVDLVNNLKDSLTSVPLAKLMAAVSFFPNVGKRRFEEVLKVYPNLLAMSALPKETLVAELQKVPGIKEIANTIADILPSFVTWLNSHPEIQVAGTRPAQAVGLISPSITLPGINLPGINPGLISPSAPTVVIGAVPGLISPSAAPTVQAQPASLLQFAPGPPAVPQTLTGVTVVFTQYRNAVLKNQIEERGGKVMDSVSGKTTLVIAGNPDNKTGSVAKAEKLGKPVLTEAQFIQQYMK